MMCNNNGSLQVLRLQVHVCGIKGKKRKETDEIINAKRSNQIKQLDVPTTTYFFSLFASRASSDTVYKELNATA